MSINLPQSAATKIEAEEALAGAGLLCAAASTPLILAKGAPWHVIWANEMAAEIFGTGDLTELTRICLNGAEPGARQLARLAQTMSAVSEIADIRLRLRLPRGLAMLDLSCRKLATSAPFFAIAPWGYVPAIQPEPAASSPTLPEQAALTAAAHPLADENAPEIARQFLEADARSPLTERRGKVRFLWRTNRDGQLTNITGALCEAVGCSSENLIGKDFRATAAELNLDSSGRLREALSRQDTWSGIEVMWPIADTKKVVPVILGALPGFDRLRAFDGFSGFGVIHLDRIEDVVETATQVLPAPAQTRPAESPAPLPEIIPGELQSDIRDDILDDEITPDPEETRVAAPAATAGQSDARAATNTIIEKTTETDPPESAKTPAATSTTPTETDANPVQAANPDTAPADDPGRNHGNVVPIRPWQKDTRPTQLVADAPNFVMPGAGSPRSTREPEQAPPQTSAASLSRDELVALSPAERNAFREIARALGARSAEKTSDEQPAAAAPAASSPATTETTRPSQSDAKSEAAAAALIAAVQAQPATQYQTSKSDANALRLLERIDSGLLVSRGGVPAFANKTLLDMLGFENIEDFHKSGGVERMFRGRDPGALSRDADGGAIPVIAANGEVLALEGRFQTIEWDNEPATLMTFRQTQGPELAARIRALELDLRKREAEARETHAVLDTATDGVVLLDEEGRILTLNKSGQALFGYDQNEVVGEPFTILLSRESHAPAMDYLNGLKSNGVKSVLNDGREIAGRVRQGATIPLFMTLGRAGISTPQRFCAVLRDLTQWKKVERELSDAKRDAERASALKSDFLAKVSHEVRTPLNAILGFAEVIMDERFGPVGNERYKDYLKDIHSSGAHVLSLVNDLLDLSKIEAGKLDLNFGSVDANRIVNECVSLIQTQATRERVIIRLSLAPRLPNIVADERSLRQIALNILSNAVKFNEPGGQVIVSTALTDAGHAVIRVRDTGIGMNDKELEMALEPFRQIATSRKTTGTGLGLPLTKALVEANRAAFTIRSRKGEGTLVEVSFPQTRVLAE